MWLFEDFGGDASVGNVQIRTTRSQAMPLPTEHDETRDAASPTRRHFIKTIGALAGGLVVGVALDDSSSAAAPAKFVPDAFITIGTDDSVTLTMARVEMGQGAYTALAMLIAEELEVELSQVVVRHAPPDNASYGGPTHDQRTGGSRTVRTLSIPMRRAGAAARTVLIRAAASRWLVNPLSCRAEGGSVFHDASGRRVKYGQLVTLAATLPLPAQADLVLKPADQLRLMGKPAKRLDTKAKTDGSAQYGIDVLLTDMRFAAVMACPVFGGKLKSVNTDKALARPGVHQVVQLDNAVAVVAASTWHAREGIADLEVEWTLGANASISTSNLRTLVQAALHRSGTVALDRGHAPAIVRDDAKRIERQYYNPMLAHAPMEPLNCTVHVQDGQAEIWCGTQAPARARDSAAKLLGLPAERVTLNGYLLGGGFGRRQEHDYIDQAVLIARHVEGPVKVTWSREEDIRHDIMRGYYAHSISASLDGAGRPTALVHKITGPSNLERYAFNWKPGNIDVDATEGSAGYPYDIPNMHVEHVVEDGPIMTGFWRGVGPGRNLLVLESFMDELAALSKRDPVAYRLDLLTKDQRAHKVLSVAAKRAGWGEAMPRRSGRGIALLAAWGTYMAQVVDLKVDSEGQVRVTRVVCAIDCGLVVNPDTVAAQMEGGINFGLTAALYDELTIRDGRVEQSNFHDCRMLRMNATPRIDVEIVQSGAPSGGVGEAGTAGFGAAFANAIFAATGKRVDTLPVRPDQLKESA